MSLFRLFRDFDDYRHVLRPHLGGLWRSRGSTLMIFDGIEDSLECPLNFKVLSETPQVEARQSGEGKIIIPGGTQPTTTDCWKL